MENGKWIMENDESAHGRISFSILHCPFSIKMHMSFKNTDDWSA